VISFIINRKQTMGQCIGRKTKEEQYVVESSPVKAPN